MSKKGVRGVCWLLAVLMALLAGCDQATKDSINEIVSRNVAENAARNGIILDAEEEAEEEQPEDRRPPLSSGPATPAVWEVTDPQGDGVLYLFGSIHVGEESLYPLSDNIMDLFESCDALSIELDLSPFLDMYSDQDFDTEDMELEEMISLLSEMLASLFELAFELVSDSFYEDGNVITDEIDEALFLRALAALDMEAQDQETYQMWLSMRPDTYVSQLGDLALQQTGLSSSYGLDAYFLQLAMERQMELLGVESVESQSALPILFSPALNAYRLEQALDIDGQAAEITAIYEAWKAGDMDALTAMELPTGLDPEEQALLDEFNKIMLTDRNGPMSDAAEAFLLEGKRVFFVVGAGHMIGDDGIVQQLTDRGYNVTRLYDGAGAEADDPAA